MSSLASAGSESPSIPEPMTVALVALAAPLILRKRRRAGIG
ncbi:MAG: PEP-CTERM sorting domain-containing protein [Phycisphaerae bacterium]